MSTPGPRRKPAELERLDGYPGKGRRQRKEDIENLPELGEIGEPFADMADETKAKWYELAKEWSTILKNTDREFLRLYCEAWYDMIESHRMCQTLGKTSTTKLGELKTSPWALRLNQQRDMVRRLLMEVGATPAARSKVMMEDGSKKSSKFEGLMN